MNPLACPACSVPADFLTFLRAGAPWRLRCGMCGARLSLTEPKWLDVAILLLYAIVLVNGVLLFALLHPPFFVGLTAFVIALVACHMAAYFLMTSVNCRLAVREGRAKQASDLSFWSDAIPAAVLALVSLALNIVCFLHQRELFSTGSSATAFSSGLCMLLPLSMGAACLGFPLLVLGLTFKASRGPSITLMACSLVHIAITMVFIGLGSDVKMKALQGIADRSEPLVQAIHRYSADKNRPPAALQDLVPNYLSAIPTPGVPACPKFEYSTGQKAETWSGNPWMLSVQVPAKFLGIERLFYLPNQDYHGKVHKQIGKWGYFSD